MTSRNHRFFRDAFLALLVLFIASTAAGRTRAVAVGSTHPAPATANAATVSGVAESVDGALIRLAGGLVIIDASSAKIVVHRGSEGTVAQIGAGMLVFAALRSGDVAADAPLPATLVTATPIPDATLFGPVQAVDRSAATLTLLGRTIHITPETSFGGFRTHRDSAPGLPDVLPNQVVQVKADEVGGRLMASSVLLLAPMPPPVHAARGTVKSIGTDSWVIARDGAGDLTLVVNAQTKIVGAPKVGDTVEVLYTTDSSHAHTAIAILNYERPTPPNQTMLFHGVVRSIEGSVWTIAASGGAEQKVTVNERTLVQPGIAVGDAVEVVAIQQEGGLVALIIMKRRG